MAKQHSPMWTFLWLSLVSVLVSLCAFRWFHVSGKALVVLLTGLEGTAALACALSPATDELSAACQHRGLRKVVWWVFEAWQFRSPVSYLPVFFYFGLLLLAASLFMSFIRLTPSDPAPN